MAVDLKTLNFRKRMLLSDIKQTQRRLSEFNQKLDRLEKEIEELQRKNAHHIFKENVYTAAASWKPKIAYVLTKSDALNVSEITNEIIKNEPKLDRKKVYSTIQRVLFRMVDELSVIKEGRYRSKYRLNSTSYQSKFKR